MQGDSCLMKVMFLEDSLKVKEENHLLFVEAASEFLSPFIKSFFTNYCFHPLLQMETEKGIITMVADWL